MKIKQAMKNQKQRETNLSELKRIEEQKQLDKETQLLAKEVEILLTSRSYALQTFLQPVMELGVIKSLEARVRLIKVNKPNTDETPIETAK